MNQSPHRFPSWHFPPSLIRGVAIASFALASAVWPQSTPEVLSVTPAEGAIGVSTNSKVVIVFDQDMNVLAPPFPSLPPTLIGNFAFTPATISVNGAWGTDKRTLTFTPTRPFPVETLITWTLNPPGMSSFVPRLSSADGGVLATVSGSFTTQTNIPIPKLISVNPTNGATNIALSSPIVFEFDREMDIDVPIETASSAGTVGNISFNPPGLRGLLAVSWGPDKRTLVLQPTHRLTFATTVSWVLNPLGASSPLRSTAGQALPATSGNYRTIIDTGGSAIEVCPPVSTATGYYELTKSYTYAQTSSEEVVLASTTQPSFYVSVYRPPAAKGGGIVTNGSITLPGGATLSLTNRAGLTNSGGGVTRIVRLPGTSPDFSLVAFSPTETALDKAYPPGTYTLRFNVQGLPEYVIPVDFPAVPELLPRIANYEEAQAIDPAHDFTLRWNTFAPHAPAAFIQLLIRDENGELIFQAPNPCASRTLFATDLSAVIPANYLRPGLGYRGSLEFADVFYDSTNSVSDAVGYGAVQRFTSFNLETIGGVKGVGVAQAKFSAVHISAGGALELELSGPEGSVYTIERTATLSIPAWIQVGTVTPGLSGKAVFLDPISAGGTRGRGNSGTDSTLFYRAVGDIRLGFGPVRRGSPFSDPTSRW